MYLLVSMATNILPIIMSIIKVINDVIITRKDITSSLVSISVISFRNTRNNHRYQIQIKLSVHQILVTAYNIYSSTCRGVKIVS